MPTINRGTKKRRDRTIAKVSYQHIYQSKRWKRVRRAKVRANPLCEICEQIGITKQVEEVHHRVPFMTGTDEYEVELLAFDFDNLQSLCIYHHKIVEKSIEK